MPSFCARSEEKEARLMEEELERVMRSSFLTGAVVTMRVDVDVAVAGAAPADVDDGDGPIVVVVICDADC